MPKRPQVGIVGLGLIGASIGKALRRAGVADVVLGVDSDADTRALACADGTCVTAEADACNLVRGACDVIFVCVPFGALAGVFADVAGTPGIVTDTCGVKVGVEDLARRHMHGVRFVGAHPMAGGTEGGFAQSRADLFDGTPVAICAASQAAQEIATLWSAMGALPVWTDPESHDAEVAHTSHLPYVAAVAQLQLLAEAPALVGRGFLDSTRHALFAQAVMTDMVAANEHLPPLLRRYADRLIDLANGLEHDMRAWHDAVKHAHDLRVRIKSR